MPLPQLAGNGTPVPRCLVEFLPRTYDELYEKGFEPRKRWLSLILRSGGSKWHIRVTFCGNIHREGVSYANAPQRRKDLQDLCRCIDFQRIRLLDDTVTEIILERHCGTVPIPWTREPETTNEYSLIVGELRLRTQEDPFRVRFPVYDCGGGTPIKDISEIEEKEEITDGVHKVRVHGDQRLYVYKQVDRPLYVPRDSEVLDQELRNLEHLGGTETSIVQLVAAVVSKNPYRTMESDRTSGPPVLRGILLEYHPNGTLEDAMKTLEPGMERHWCKWALQITNAVAHLHRHGLTHMDLKPSNVVISEDFNAILIDLSGIGGVTRQWLSPEMLKVNDPLARGIQERKQQDIWALGLIFAAMADACCFDEERQLLKRLAASATVHAPPRLPLGDAISALSEHLQRVT